MSALFWLRPVPSCCIIWNAAGGGLQPTSTTGRQDKRPDARGVYGVVVVGVFACCALGRSAALTAISLITLRFYRATPDFAVACK
ncbi:hypothetical protein [Ponticaulis sp.]|uniref:hypothetical protein n=1 Tax=Ponticaulis sp. TaxID=2020902 RepID=UPI0025F3AC64|nr:hypothetical protein [Ponticaulis sp.]